MEELRFDKKVYGFKEILVCVAFKLETFESQCVQWLFSLIWWRKLANYSFSFCLFCLFFKAERAALGPWEMGVLSLSYRKQGHCSQEYMLYILYKLVFERGVHWHVLVYILGHGIIMHNGNLWKPTICSAYLGKIFK